MVSVLPASSGRSSYVLYNLKNFFFNFTQSQAGMPWLAQKKANLLEVGSLGVMW